MYQVASSKAEEFIHDGEIVETLAYARSSINEAARELAEKQRSAGIRDGRSGRPG